MNRLETYSDDIVALCSVVRPLKQNSRTVYHPVGVFVPDNMSWTRNIHDHDIAIGAGSSSVSKFHDLSDTLARMLFSSSDLAHIELPFNLSDEEDSLIRQDNAIMILGRSGTGKTTVILHRMVLLQKVSHEPIKQLLVTASPLLCKAIQQQYEKMCETAQHMENCASRRGEGDVVQDASPATVEAPILCNLDAADEDRMTTISLAEVSVLSL